uniref:Alpha-carbonic anhydrase domain-containing protein n=1 Tax=Strombidium rassoulzadegani TaxID=1082188 RepID=A0A7S3FX27_9SPIT|mmetsp:Transcript_5578/g.9585  ORF Transcript_5578/g.9585 Transcript_5578/m.9585 type:complete len:147 (+) Transcript_5578:567-1007(+)
MREFSDSVTQEQNQTISKFFSQLRLDLESMDEDETGPDEFGFVVDIGTLSFNELMSALNLKRRWAYLGNSSVPPCKKYVYWNVLQTVYPIEAKYFSLIKKKYEGRLNNARAIFPINKHNIVFISAIRLLATPLTALLAVASLTVFS